MLQLAVQYAVDPFQFPREVAAIQRAAPDLLPIDQQQFIRDIEVTVCG